MFECNSFIVKELAKLFGSRKAYDILDGESGRHLGTAVAHVSTTWRTLGIVLGKDSVPVTIDVREKPDDSLVFSVRRTGLLVKRLEAIDSQGQSIGTYRTRRLSLTGGFHVFDHEGRHFCDVRGKLLNADYAFVTPDGKAELGKVTRQWGGVAKELFTSAATYGVRINLDFAELPIAKMLMLGATLALDAFYKKASN